MRTNGLTADLTFPAILPKCEKNACFLLYKRSEFVYNKEDNIQNILCVDASVCMAVAYSCVPPEVHLTILENQFFGGYFQISHMTTEMPVCEVQACWNRCAGIAAQLAAK